MFKKIILYFVNMLMSDRDFRLKLFKLAHDESQNYFGEQTVPGRFYEVCEEFFQTGPPLLFSTKINIGEAIKKYYDEKITDIKANPRTYFKNSNPIKFNGIHCGMYISTVVGFGSKREGFVEDVCYDNDGNGFLWVDEFDHKGQYKNSFTASASYCDFTVHTI